MKYRVMNNIVYLRKIKGGYIIVFVGVCLLVDIKINLRVNKNLVFKK